MLNKFVFSLAIMLSFPILNASACTRSEAGDHREGRVWVTEYRIRIGETCTVTFSRSINQSTEKIELTNISSSSELNVKTSTTKENEPTISYSGTKEGEYVIDYYLSSMVPGEGVEAHWQRLRVKVTK
jgi:hypothetical protein